MLINKLINLFFRCILYSMIVINYIYFINYIWSPSPSYNFTWIVIFLFHLILILTLWSLFVTSRSDAGQVPLYWGFYVGDSDAKRRRYCLMCNVFKPERCHHCSLCNRCVLNMDHHCPWINNCIGYFNRKFFIQMLFYFNLTLVFILLANGKFTFDIILKLIMNRVNFKTELTQCLILLFVYVIDIAALAIVGLFFKFHLMLIMENKTTIETIDKKGEKFDSAFDKGYYNNWLQVMGTSKLLWFLPLKMYMGIPLGNGIDWQESLLTASLEKPNSSNDYNSKWSMYKSNNSNYVADSSINPPRDTGNVDNMINPDPMKKDSTSVSDTAISAKNRTSSQIELTPQINRTVSPLFGNKINIPEITNLQDIKGK